MSYVIARIMVERNFLKFFLFGTGSGVILLSLFLETYFLQLPFIAFGMALIYAAGYVGGKRAEA